MKKLMLLLMAVPYAFANNGLQNSIGRIVDLIQEFALFFVRISPDYQSVAGLARETLVSAGLLKIACAVIFGVLIKEGMKIVPVFDEFEKKSKHTIQWVLSILLVVLTPVQLVVGMSEGILSFVLLVFSSLVGVVAFFICKHIYDWGREEAGL